ncbi:hypothetical protein pb186bvf_002640 [Paramecium bursaria]
MHSTDLLSTTQPYFNRNDYINLRHIFKSIDQLSYEIKLRAQPLWRRNLLDDLQLIDYISNILMILPNP